MEPILYFAVIVAGFLAGFINTLAGSGSAITLPLLVFLGLPATVANGTNRIGVLFQTTMSTTTYHRAGVMPWRDANSLLVPAIIGGIVGAYIAVDLNEQQMRLAIATICVHQWIMIHSHNRKRGPVYDENGRSLVLKSLLKSKLPD